MTSEVAVRHAVASEAVVTEAVRSRCFLDSASPPPA